MSDLVNDPVVLETTNFSPRPSTFTTLPVLTLDPAEDIEKNLTATIQSDDDIKLPDITDLKIFDNPTVSTPLNDFLNFEFDSFNFDVPEEELSVPETVNETNAGTLSPSGSATVDIETSPLSTVSVDFPTYDFDGLSIDENLKTTEQPLVTIQTIPEGSQNDDFLSFDFDGFSLNEGSNATETPSVNIEAAPESSLNDDFLSYDFDGFSFDDNSNKTEEPANDLFDGGFLNYDFDSFNFDDSGPSNGTEGDESFDLFNFQDYNFDADLFATDPEEGGEVLDNNYISDDWVNPDYEYEEKTSEEIRKEREDFDKEWSSLVQPPIVRFKPPYIIDLVPWLLWGPALACLGFLLIAFTPCICLMWRDDRRERAGKKRKYGPPRFGLEIVPEPYEKLPSGEWRKITNKKNSCVLPETPVFIASGAVSLAKDNSSKKTSYSIENEKRETSRNTTVAPTHSPLKGKSKEVRNVDLGEGTELGPSTSGSNATTKEYPGTSGDANWSMY